MSDLIFHITTREQWQQAQEAGLYRPDSLATDGFIHCSTAAQVMPVANFYYRGQSGLIVLGIDVARSGVEVRYETGYTGDLFPHLYGAFPVSAVCQVIDLEADPTGEWITPQELNPYAR